MNWKETVEYRRLADSKARRADWQQWGPYVSERAWGTVREDYSASGDAWSYFPHDHARSRAYRWNEDGLGGFCNRFQNTCLAVALWNEQDPILKERLFGLTPHEGNHGEDVKELYFYLDGLPSHAYMCMLYQYPQVAYPYARLVEENRRRGRDVPEFELLDALPDVFAEGRYFDVVIEYAKAAQEDILCKITAINRGPDAAPLHVLPHLWHRNTWSWGYNPERPETHLVDSPPPAVAAVYMKERHLGERWWYVAEAGHGEAPSLLFTENDTNHERLFGTGNETAYVKDAFHRAIIHGETEAVNPAQRGTKVAAHVQTVLPPGERAVIWVRFSDAPHSAPFDDAEAVFEQRQQETDAFYAAVRRPGLNEDQQRIQRQAWAGLLWSKQFYHYSVDLWLEGDPAQPDPPEVRKDGRNADWEHLYNLDKHAMPDKWEYPWYAAWDSAFHTVPLAMIDPEWAKRQLILLLREWYMHPNGQIPAYEWNFGDVNPPVHAWAAWRVYQTTAASLGYADTPFLERIFHKLLLNFTWWVNRKDRDGNNIFQGGFLGLDNIGVFDRSQPVPTGGYIDQADGTAWMAMYCLNLWRISMELARIQPAYEDVATKFFEHFVYIADVLTHMGSERVSLWDPEDGFFYDVLHHPDGHSERMRLRSFVGLIPLFAVETLEPALLEQLPHFRRRMEWFMEYRPHLIKNMAPLTEPGVNGRRLISLLDEEMLSAVLTRMLDPEEFLSPYGLRSLSRYHHDHPYVMDIDGRRHVVAYEPGESRTELFGGNSNWRGPVWFPVNYLMIEALRKYHQYYGEAFTVELPQGSGRWMTLAQVADELSQRLLRLFLEDGQGQRPVFGERALFHKNPDWHDRLLFYEYFHGDDGHGLGASHQTGWTALVATLLQEEYGGPTCTYRPTGLHEEEEIEEWPGDEAS